MSSGKFISLNGKLELSTEFCNEVQIIYLINALNCSFGLVCSIWKKKSSYAVIISKESVKILQTHVALLIIPSLKYKIGLYTNSYNSKPCNNLVRRIRFFSISTMNKFNKSLSRDSSDNSSSVSYYANPIILKDVIIKENRNRGGVYLSSSSRAFQLNP